MCELSFYHIQETLPNRHRQSQLPNTVALTSDISIQKNDNNTRLELFMISFRKSIRWQIHDYPNDPELSRPSLRSMILALSLNPVLLKDTDGIIQFPVRSESRRIPYLVVNQNDARVSISYHKNYISHDVNALRYIENNHGSGKVVISKESEQILVQSECRIPSQTILG
jgi:hypothetical protein